MFLFLQLFLQLYLTTSFLFAVDWTKQVPYPLDGRANPYQLSEADLAKSIRAGRLHSLNYPVETSGMLLPYHPIKNFIDEKTKNPFRLFIEKMFSSFTQFHSYSEMMAWVGLHEYPDQEGEGPYFVPFANGTKPDYRMGETLIQTKLGTAMTIGCAECHSANLFGKRIIGLTNRFPRANEFFLYGVKGIGLSNSYFFKDATGATEGERLLFKRAKDNAIFIESKKPAALGLDTSLAHVAMSLSHRALDEFATKDAKVARSPREEPLRNFVSDSKPGVWWNIKYKNRWLLDGSVVSGNPIFTNLIWNEIGRGSDLQELEKWLDQNDQIVRDLTTAVTASEAPAVTDFFDPTRIKLDSAKRGELLFRSSCTGCHGQYEKAWNLPQASLLSQIELLKTTKVFYHQQTPVVDVGTDPNRYLSVASLLQLNQLSISKKNGIVIEQQKGYVPPPLVGIWARWPYFHNNSAPNLCAVISIAADRPKKFWVGEANNQEQDFDFECNGYPIKNVPAEWKQSNRLFDTSKSGLANTGHEIANFTDSEKKDLIQFLQTL